jgi:glutamate/aspartate transport system substrate-binding protein
MPSPSLIARLRRLAVAGALAAACAPAPAAAPPAGSPTLDRIAATGVVHVGFIPTPGTFAFLGPDGQATGYSIDLCLRVVDAIRRALARPDLRVAWRPLEAAQRIPLLKSGAIDLECGGNTNTAARQRDVDFSFTFFNTGARFLVKKPFEVEGSSSLMNRKVAVTRGTTAQDVVRRLVAEQGATMVPVDDDAQGVRLVETGQVAAFVQDDILLYGLIAASPRRDELQVSGRFLTVEPYAFMLPKGDLPLRELVDRTFQGLFQSGEVLALYRKWFDTDRLRVPMSVYMQENLRFPNRYGIP